MRPQNPYTARESAPRIRRLTGPIGVALVLTALLLPLETVAGSDPEGPRALVHQTTKDLVVAFSEQDGVLRSTPGNARTLVERFVVPHVDLERTAMWVLGRHWSKATPEQRREFISEFRVLLINTYITAFTEFMDAAAERIAAGASVNEFLSSTVTYLPVRTNESGTEATVQARVEMRNRPPIGVAYRLHKGEGSWKVFDIEIEGISLVMTHRASFSAVVRNVGIEGLIQQLANKSRRDTHS